MRVLLTTALAVGLTLPMAVRQSTTARAEFSESVGLSQWDLEGDGRWRMTGGVLVLDEAGLPAGPIRKPGAIAVFRSAPFGDVVLDVGLRSTAPADLAVRDVLLIFGYQSPTRFYYVHLSAKTDGVHNGIFLVNDSDRRRLDEPTSVARLTDQAWHRVRLERNATTGLVRVFFDDDPVPVLSATDRTIPSGRVGVGSFDETAEFRRFAVTGSR